MNTPLDSTTDQDECSSAASFAHSLVVAPLDTANTIHNISLALNNGSDATQADVSMDLTTTSTDADALMKDVTDAVQSNMTATEQQQQQPAEARMAVAELLVSLAQNSRSNEASTSQDDGTAAATSAFVSAVTGNPQPITDMTQESPIFKNAVDYVGSVKKAYENNPKVYTEFLSALGEYHNQNLPLDRMVQTVMTLFQDQPDLLLGFKEFLPEAQEILNQLVPPMMYSDYKGNASKIEVSNVGSPATTRATIPAALIATP
ncbi:Transcriptional regulatory protein sin3, partial [Lobosporangium transversale]